MAQRSVRASKDCQKGSQVAFLPTKCMLSQDIVNASVVGMRLAGMATDMASVLSHDGRYPYGSSAAAMALFMVREAFAPVSEPEEYHVSWKPYLDSLPKTYTLPLCWPEGTAEKLLAGTDLLNLTLEKRAWLEGVLYLAQESMGDLFPSDSLNWNSLLWAYSAISSRAFPLLHSSTGHSIASIANNTEDKGLCLWPILDLLNHSPHAKIEWSVSADGVSFVTQEPVAEGALLLNNYGPKGNENLLSNYGFVIKNNPSDYVKVTLNVRQDNGALATAKNKLLQSASLEPNSLCHMLFLPEDTELKAEVSPGLLAMTRVLVANEWELQAIQADFKAHTKPVSLRNEVAARDSLLRLLRDKHSRLINSAPTIKGPDAFELMATTYRDSQIQILAQNLALLTKSFASFLNDSAVIGSEQSGGFLTVNHPFVDADLSHFFLSLESADWDEDTFLSVILLYEKSKTVDSHWRGFFSSIYTPSDPIVERVLG